MCCVDRLKPQDSVVRVDTQFKRLNPIQWLQAARKTVKCLPLQLLEYIR